MKKVLFFFMFLLLSPSSWACFLVKGDIKVNNDVLKIHQKVEIDQSYPYRTANYLVHLKFLSSKKNPEQMAQVIVRHPKTFKVLGEIKMKLEENKESEALMESSHGFILTTNLTYQKN